MIPKRVVIEQRGADCALANLLRQAIMGGIVKVLTALALALALALATRPFAAVVGAITSISSGDAIADGESNSRADHSSYEAA
jgi:hypothetical protein